MIIYMHNTLNYLASGHTEILDSILTDGEMKQTESGINYIKIL